jgi:nitrilase
MAMNEGAKCGERCTVVDRHADRKVIEPGKQVKVVDSPFGRIGLSVCYDLRFPELYRAMKDMDIIVVPSAFTETTGRAHWEALVRARAIENLSYVLAPAQGGYHVSGRETHGDSMIVDPWGTVLDRLPRGSGIVSAWVNPRTRPACARACRRYASAIHSI